MLFKHTLILLTRIVVNISMMISKKICSLFVKLKHVDYLYVQADKQGITIIAFSGGRLKDLIVFFQIESLILIDLSHSSGLFLLH